MKLRKLLSLVLSLMLLSTMFAAIANAESSQLEGEITFWHSFSQGPRLENIQKAADAFVKANPKVKITIETFSWADFYTKWTTGLASGNVPDMSTALPNHVVEMIDVDAILPLDTLIDRIGRDRFNQAPLTEMTIDGKCYAVPLYSHAQVMWYRKDLLEKYSLEVPTTWDELYDAATTITEGEGGAAMQSACGGAKIQRSVRLDLMNCANPESV